MLKRVRHEAQRVEYAAQRTLTGLVALSSQQVHNCVEQVAQKRRLLRVLPVNRPLLEDRPGGSDELQGLRPFLDDHGVHRLVEHAERVLSAHVADHQVQRAGEVLQHAEIRNGNFCELSCSKSCRKWSWWL